MFFKHTKGDILTLEADNTQTLTLNIDAAFAVRHDMKSHTRATCTLGKGAIVANSTKQKVNPISSTESKYYGIKNKNEKIFGPKNL